MTEDAISECGMRKDDEGRWCILCSDMDADQGDLSDCVKRWPQVNFLLRSQRIACKFATVSNYSRSTGLTLLTYLLL